MYSVPLQMKPYVMHGAVLSASILYSDIIDFCFPVQTLHKFPNGSPSCHQNKTQHLWVTTPDHPSSMWSIKLLIIKSKTIARHNLMQGRKKLMMMQEPWKYKIIQICESV